MVTNVYSILPVAHILWYSESVRVFDVCVRTVPSKSVSCPFNDAFWLAYNNNSGGFCDYPASYVSPCASSTHLHFRLQKCSHAAYTYQRGINTLYRQYTETFFEGCCVRCLWLKQNTCNVFSEDSLDLQLPLSLSIRGFAETIFSEGSAFSQFTNKGGA